MKNRKLPFGYRMEQGKIVCHPQEAEVVRQIFQSYIAGASYRDLVAMLSEQTVPYDAGRPWNKNMVARILEDKRYIGDGLFPKIISEASLTAAAGKRSDKQSPSRQTEAQKVFRQLSGRKATPKLEQQALDLLNRLSGSPELIQLRQFSYQSSGQIAQLKSELDAVFEQQPINEDSARSLILAIATAEYTAIGPEEYETERLRRIFVNAESQPRLDADLLRSTISSIQLSEEGSIILRLKNNQIIGSNAL